MLRSLYTLGIYGLIFLMRLGAAFGDSKLKKGILGRRNNKVFWAVLANRKAPLIWIHAASLGEYEQGRSLLEGIQKSYPRYKILLTFFSPSGYARVRSNTNLYTAYLPLDTPHEVAIFLDTVRPEMGIFIKYELWLNLLIAAKRRAIPLILVAAFMKPQALLPFYHAYKRKALLQFSYVFTQDEKTRALLATFLETDRVVCVGDPRRDRMRSLIKERDKNLDWVANFVHNQGLFIAGSIWKKDIAMLRFAKADLLALGMKICLVPHEIKPAYLASLLADFPSSVLLSHLKKNDPRIADLRIIIVDQVGILSKLYAFATLAYVGGGWRKKGLHNVMEPVAQGCFTIVGKYVEDFQEVEALVAAGCVRRLSHSKEFSAALRAYQANPNSYKKLSLQAKAYLLGGEEVSGKIISVLHEKRLLTS